VTATEVMVVVHDVDGMHQLSCPWEGGDVDLIC